MYSRSRKKVGAAAEEQATVYFQELGWRVAQRNWRCRSGEIDLVACDGETLVFIEVRSRTAPGRYGTAIEAITPRKCRQVRETAEVYLRVHGISGRPVRFDVVAITFNNDGTVEELKHIKNAF